VQEKTVEAIKVMRSALLKGRKAQHNLPDTAAAAALAATLDNALTAVSEACTELEYISINGLFPTGSVHSNPPSTQALTQVLFEAQGELKTLQQSVVAVEAIQRIKK
jgi:hypothetical protein